MSDKATEESRQVWDSLASGWAKNRTGVNDIERPVTELMYNAIHVQPGDTILELCAGPGGVGLGLASLHPDMNLVITDFAPAMVEVAREECERLGLKNVKLQVMDAQKIDLEDSSIDGVLCRYGLMLVPDFTKAFTEIRRVLRPGRTLAYATWAPIEQNPWMAVFGAAMIQLGHFKPPEGGSLMSLSTIEDNAAVANSAGFQNVSTEVMDIARRYETFDEYWTQSIELGGPLAMIYKTLSEEERKAVHDLAEQYSASFFSDGSLTFPSRRLFTQAS
ncbi:MAG: class I SAM-dependent methyltransferase [Actinomycetota bacterium]